jgi:hypothetical protein
MLSCFNHTARSVPGLEPLLETGNAKKRGDGLALAPAVRSRYHRTSAESGWNIRKRQANWIMLQRARELPALLIPLSRRHEPLSSRASETVGDAQAAEPPAY